MTTNNNSTQEGREEQQQSMATSLSTRASVYWDSIPLVTKSILTVCVSIYLAGALIGWDNFNLVCLSADTVVSRLQLWRVGTSAFFHAGLLHVAFNMMAFVPMGSTLERSLGSGQFAFLIFLLLVLGDAVYVATPYVVAFVGFPALLSHCAVGFSGVIFGLIPSDVRASGGPQRSVFGLFAVPSNAYPWVLLVLWQFLVPQSSFMGHMAGLVIGQVYAVGHLRWLVPSSDRMQQWERNAALARCVSIPSYIANTGSSGISEGGGSSAMEPLLPTNFAPPAWLSRANWNMPSFGALGAAMSESPSRPQQQQQHSSPFVGAVLGGAPPAMDPKAAAALAAEARMVRSNGGGGQQQPQKKMGGPSGGS